MEDAGESVADVFLYNSSQTLIAQLAIIAPSTGTTAVAMDFTAYSDVARFEIRNVTDNAGFAIDRIVIDTVGVPAPGAIALLGLAGLAGRRRR
jgi:MYXO-CTERM domain-containing protein